MTDDNNNNNNYYQPTEPYQNNQNQEQNQNSYQGQYQNQNPYQGQYQNQNPYQGQYQNQNPYQGQYQNQNPYQGQYQNPYQNQPMPPQEQKASVGLAILSFIIPLAGLIIFLSYKDKRPKTAKTSGICALVGFILGIIFSVISNVIVASNITKGVMDDDSYYSDYGDEYDYDLNEFEEHYEF